MKHLRDLDVLVLGLGASGLAMARWCARHGARVTVADSREAPPQLAALQSEVPAAAFVGGPFGEALVQGTLIRAVYRSPGLSPAAIAPVVDAAKAMGLVVGGELDLFARALADLRTPDDDQPAETDKSEEAMEVDAPSVDDELASARAELERQPEAEPEVGAEAEPEAEPEAGPETDDRASELTAPVPPVPAERGYAPVVLAITGTNGKTTVTALTGQLVERAGKTVAVAGNIGPTLLDTLAAHLDAGTLPQVWVLELSSFQLDGVQGFEPTAAVVLNVTQDHLDWHGDLEAYAGAKARVFGSAGLMVLNRDDPRVMAMLPAPTKTGKFAKARVQRSWQTFGAGMPTRPGDWGIERINGMGWLVRALEADETQKRKRGAAEDEEVHIQRLMPADALRIRGRHNALNALAALALAHAAQCQLGPVLYGLREYHGEPHRVESIAVIDEVEYFDDSKGTNVGATVAALSGLGEDRRLVVILGGEGKGQDFGPLADPVRRHARAVVLIGRDAPLIREVLESTGVPLLPAASMAEAVALAAGHAQGGDAVLLSPACASFDMFKDYEDRARAFREAALAHQETAR
ncbi:UDP-N-acetylmuramoylalanine--D-glutamate ligase [Burkholderiales bacterium 8X]|nr:UDP-N-acetylmuramoylalanine--D-glutamate ligase [Burkholderiales bacterium 8X]